MDLRANTAIDVLIGPFVDDADGNSVEDGLTISQADVLLSKNGEALTQKSDNTACANDSLGYYNCELDATDLNTEGSLVLVVHESGALPVRHEFNVLSVAAWDSLYAPKDTGFMDINVEAWQDTVVTLGNDLPDVNMDSIDDVDVSGVATAGKLHVFDDAGASMPTAVENRQEMDSNSTRLSAIETDTGQIGTAGAGLSDLGGMSDGMKAEVQVEADDAIVANHLDHLLKTTYDPASKPGAADALLNELVENDGGVSRYTENALEQAPSGTGGDATEAKQDAIIATLGAPADIDGGGSTLADNLKKIVDDSDGAAFDATTDSLKKIRDDRTLPAADYTNLTKINGETVPVDNLQDQYDTTGLIGDTFPANQSQIGSLTSGSAAISTTAEFAPNGFVLTAGQNEALDEDSTHALDGATHDLLIDGTIDGYYIFNVGVTGVPVSVTWQGYLLSNADTFTFWAWNWTGTPAWEQIGTRAGTISSAIVTDTFDLTNAHVNPADGEVRFRIFSADGVRMSTDRILCSFAVVNQSVGYANGAVWIDTAHGDSGVELYVNGTADNPVDTLASAMAIAEALNIHRFEVTAGSALQFIEDMTGWVFAGSNYTIDFNGQNSDSLLISGATVSNELTATGGGIGMIQCRLSDGCTLPAGGYKGCTLPGDITLGGVFYIFDGCISAVAGTSTPSIDFVNENVSKSVNFRSYSGGIEVRNFGHGTATHTMSLEGNGQLVLHSSCSNADAGDVVAIRGNFTVTDNVGGGWGGITSDDARYDKAQVLDAVVDDATRIDASSINAVEADVATLQTSVNDVPNTAEFEARSIVAADYTVVGDNMNLADNAITAAKFDQSTAHPMANADGSDLTEVGGDGAQLTEAGGDGDHLVEAGGDGDHLVEAGGDGDQLTAIAAVGTVTDSVAQSADNDTLLTALDVLTKAAGDGDLAALLTATQVVETQIGTAGDGLTDLGAMSDTMKTEVNDQVKDVLTTDTIAEQTPGTPPTAPTFEEAIMYLYMALTKKIDVDATFKEFYNNAGAVVWKKSLSDDGSNYVEAKGQSGS
jgi:hypothetical protein